MGPSRLPKQRFRVTVVPHTTEPKVASEVQLVVIKLSGATDADGDPLAFALTAATQDEKIEKVAGKGDKNPDARRVSGEPEKVNLARSGSPG